MKRIITQKGYKSLSNKIETLKKEIKEVQTEKAVAYTASGDGWHDNPGFNQLEQKEFRLANELNALLHKRESSTLWSQKERNKERVQIGSIIDIKQHFLSTGNIKMLRFEIVGHGESDFKARLLAYDTPIGQKIMGLKVNNKIEVQLPIGKVEITICKFH